MRARGLMYGLLILIAIAVGVLVSGVPTRRGDAKLAVSSEQPSTAPGAGTYPPATTTPASTATPTVARASTSSTTVSHAPGDIDVLVANASGVNNAASTRARAIKTSG